MLVSKALALLRDLGIAATPKRASGEFRSLSSPEYATSDQLCYAFNVDEGVRAMNRGVLFIKDDIDREAGQLLEKKAYHSDFNFILCEDPKLAFIIVANELFKDSPRSKWGVTSDGVHIQGWTSIDPSADISPGVCIYKGAIIKAGVTIEANSVIGATGTNFKWHQGVKYVMPQVGYVHLSEGCFVGANVTIVRGAFESTVIGSNAMIAHGSNIGHDVQIGRDSFLANGVNVAGYVKMGDSCWIGAGVSIKNRVELGHRTKVGAGASVIKGYGNDQTLVGVPAKPIGTK